jgi:hypothetical protein
MNNENNINNEELSIKFKNLNLNSSKMYYYSNKIRLGCNYGPHSGCYTGYVIGETNGNYDCYISAGVFEESFSRDFINKYNMNATNSFAFDGTINNYPRQYTKNITFYKRNISPYKDRKNATLEYFINKYDNIFLKMDIEGAEYPWLKILSSEQLNKFKQIVIEFHGINDDNWGTKLEDKIKCFEKLSETHYPIHAHENNSDEIYINIPNVIKLTYLRKNLFKTIPLLNTEIFPIENLNYMNNKINLVLGWCQGYMGLKYHMEEALIEKGINQKATFCPLIALFSKKYYYEICNLNHNKIYDFCFIGSINSNYESRKWVIDFAKKNFTNNSIFINTDNDTNWISLGSFDYSNKKLGYCPKIMPNNHTKKVQYRVVKENITYFGTMCRSKYCLCPAGDAPWSFRFYEVLMCKSIPIVESWHHTYRTKEEANINYKYVLYENINDEINYDEINYDDYINENIRIFENYHLLK